MDRQGRHGGTSGVSHLPTPRSALSLLLALSVWWCLLLGEGGARLIGCPDIGAVFQYDSDLEIHGQRQILLSEHDFTEEDCAAFRAYFSLPALPRYGERRDEAMVWHQNRTDYGGDEECSGRGWLISDAAPACHCFYEAGGDTCDVESERAGRKVKGAVVYLLYGNDTTYFEHLMRSLASMQLSFLGQFPYPVVIFHSPFFAETPDRPGGGESLLEVLRARVSSDVELIFEEVTVMFPEALRSTFEASPPTGGGCAATEYPLNFLHMGRFFQHDIFRHPRLLEFDYVWRIDADLELPMGVPCDVFDVMRRSHAVFGYYYFSDFEDGRCGVSQGREATERYASQRGFEPNHLRLMPPRSAYLGAFNVFDVRFWTSPQSLAFQEYMDGLGLAYTRRMGEQVFYALATSLLVQPAALHQYAGLGPFRHRGTEIIFGKREVNGINVIADDVWCPEASEWDCNDFFECEERAPAARGAGAQQNSDIWGEL